MAILACSNCGTVADEESRWIGCVGDAVLPSKQGVLADWFFFVDSFQELGV